LAAAKAAFGVAPIAFPMHLEQKRAPRRK